MFVKSDVLNLYWNAEILVEISWQGPSQVNSITQAHCKSILSLETTSQEKFLHTLSKLLRSWLLCKNSIFSLPINSYGSQIHFQQHGRIHHL